MTTDAPSLLLLSGGSLVGQNIVQAIGQRRHGLKLVATNSVSDDPSLVDFDEIVLTVPTRSHPEEFAKAIEAIIDRKKPALAIPCRDDDVLALARLAERRPDLAPHLLCGPVALAERTLDKWMSWEFARANDLPFVPTIVPTDTATVAGFVRDWGLPLLIKPRLGYASRGVRIVWRREQLDAVVGDTTLLVQRYLGSRNALENHLSDVQKLGAPLFCSLEETKHSVQVIIGPDGSPAGLFTTCHRMKQGISQTIDRDNSADSLVVGEQCATAFAAAGWRGPLNIQCQRAEDGKLYIYEFNGRFTGATAARTLLGYDEVAQVLSLFAGRILPPIIGQADGRAVKQPVTRCIPADMHSALNNHGTWPAQAPR